MKERTYILLADDDPDDRFLFLQALHAVNPDIPVQPVADGQAVLEFLERQASDALPTLIVLDYKMPVLSGPDVLQQLAACPAYAKIPKVVWSTSNRSQDIDRCIRLGAAGYFLKPASYGNLLEIIHPIERIFSSQLQQLANSEPGRFGPL